MPRVGLGVGRWMAAQSAAMSITVHLWSVAAAWICSVPLPRTGVPVVGVFPVAVGVMHE